MNKIDLSKAIGILANMGVIAGIIFLGIEIRQNNLMLMAQTRSTLSEGSINMLSRITATPEITELYEKGRNRIDELTDTEEARFQYLVFAEIRYHENVFSQYKFGLYSEEEYLAQKGVWQNIAYISEGVVNVWCRVRGSFAQDFQEEINSVLTTYRCEGIEE